MKSFFRFTAGEWAASALMAILIIAGILFYFLYDNSAVAHSDYTEYRELFAQFEQEQQRLADSVEAARKWGYRRARAYSGDSASGAGGMAESSSKNYKNHHGEQYQHKWQYAVETRHGTSLQHAEDSLRKQPQRPQYAIVKVELNTADTSDIMRIPGFGSKRAQKMVEYRDKLGGFYDLSQLKEIFILQNVNLEYVEKYFSINRSRIKKIKINECDYKTMVSHPYFDSYLTKTILNYRQKNGPISDMAQLREITHIYAELAEKLQWYVAF